MAKPRTEKTMLHNTVMRSVSSCIFLSCVLIFLGGVVAQALSLKDVAAMTLMNSVCLYDKIKILK